MNKKYRMVIGIVSTER